MSCGKDGGLQNLEILGVLSIRINSEDDGKIRIAVRNNDARALQLQVKRISQTLFCIISKSLPK